MDGQMQARFSDQGTHSASTGPAPSPSRSGMRTRPAEPCERADLSLLVQAVEREVIPRLLSAHKKAPPARRLPSLGDVEQLATHVLENDSRAAHRLIETLMDNGIGVEAIYLNLLGATARMLGEMWEQDRVNFIDVTVGLCTLHQILFRLAPEIEQDAPEAGRRALFAPVPGETHIFGALIVAKFFNRAGWRSWTEIATESGRLTELTRAHDFDLIGLSISCDRHIGALTDTITGLRATAPGAHILIGGHSVDINPGLAERVGADSSAANPSEAVTIAERVVDKAQANV